MNNVPKVNLGIVAVSRDCFPVELSRKRRVEVVKACRAKKIPAVGIETVVENEKDALNALEELKKKKVNALALYLGNFGPEGPTTILAQKFEGPVMVAAAAEESGKNLVDGRGDAYCGLLNTSYNAGLRKLRLHIPEYPVGTPEDIADMIAAFIPVARIILGLKRLKIFSFGPRPQDFLACNAPIKPLYDIGVEIMENSELDLYDIFLKAKGSPKIKAVAKNMARELGAGNAYPDLLDKLAQYEVALTRFMENNLGASEYAVFANKCWPSYESYFGFVPCYVNSRTGDAGNSRLVRSGHLRGPERIHGDMRHGAAGHASRHQQHRPGGYDQSRRKKSRSLQADRPLDGLSLRKHGLILPHRRRAEISAHHAPPDGAGQETRHHPGHARRPDPERRHHHLPPPVHGRYDIAFLYRGGGSP